jgi:hypothetical protein
MSNFEIEYQADMSRNSGPKDEVLMELSDNRAKFVTWTEGILMQFDDAILEIDDWLIPYEPYEKEKTNGS